MSAGKVEKRGFMLQKRSKSSLPFKTWKKRYYILVGAPNYQLRSYEGPNSAKAPTVVDLSDLLEVTRVEDSKGQGAKGTIGVAGSLSRVGLLQPPHYCQFAMQFLRSATHMACLTAADMEDWYTRIFLLVEEAHSSFLEQSFSNGDFVESSAPGQSSVSPRENLRTSGGDIVIADEPDEREMELKFSLPLDEEADSSTLLDQHMQMRRRYTVFYEEEDGTPSAPPAKCTLKSKDKKGPRDSSHTPTPSPFLETTLAEPPVRLDPSTLCARAPSAVPASASPLQSPKPVLPPKPSADLHHELSLSPDASDETISPSRSPRSPRDENGNVALPPRPRLPTRFQQPE